MNRNGWLGALAAGGLLAAVGPAVADYETHPGIRPEARCVDGAGNRFDHGSADADGNTPAGIDTIHCQRLFWDLPSTPEVGAVRVGAPFDEDLIPRFPRGVTDRLPPMYVGADGNGYEKPGPDRTPLCGPFEVPYWKALLKEDGDPVIGTDDNGFHDVADPTKPQAGPLFEVACNRGSRAYYGPWQVGSRDNRFDEQATTQMLRFENTERLKADAAAGLADPNALFEWSVRSEFYNHFSSHHGTCYFASPGNGCSGPKPASAYEEGGECYAFQRHGDPGGNCYTGDVDPGCGTKPSQGPFRNATQIPGRLSITFASEARGVQEVEDQVWLCNHHVVTQLPPGSYGMNRLANYRLQKGGLLNDTTKSIYGVPAGEIIGGAVGEMIINNLTAAAKSGTKPLNVMFNVGGDLATTWYPPFTWNYHTSLWFAPFDAAVTLSAIHSHHRMVKGYMDILPNNPVRPNSPNPACGGSKYATEGKVPAHVHENWEWEDALVCEYWKDPDGPVVIRKGEQIATTCYVNNGVTPEAIKHGLVAGDAVAGLRAAVPSIPDYNEIGTQRASLWGDVLADSPVGRELLYGTHPPINYRVVYKCGGGFYGQGKATAPYAVNRTICDPNPALDADGDYIDGPYRNDAQCGGNLCEPSTIIFACVGEDEMCIGVAAYYALPRLGDTSGSQQGHEEAMDNLANPDTSNPFALGNDVGTPGNTGLTPDYGIPLIGLGSCPECGDRGL